MAESQRYAATNVRLEPSTSSSMQPYLDPGNISSGFGVRSHDSSPAAMASNGSNQPSTTTPSLLAPLLRAAVSVASSSLPQTSNSTLQSLSRTLHHDRPGNEYVKLPTNDTPHRDSHSAPCNSSNNQRFATTITENRFCTSGNVDRSELNLNRVPCVDDRTLTGHRIAPSTSSASSLVVTSQPRTLLTQQQLQIVQNHERSRDPQRRRRPLSPPLFKSSSYPPSDDRPPPRPITDDGEPTHVPLDLTRQALQQQPQVHRRTFTDVRIEAIPSTGDSRTTRNPRSSSSVFSVRKKTRRVPPPSKHELNNPLQRRISSPDCNRNGTTVITGQPTSATSLTSVNKLQSSWAVHQGGSNGHPFSPSSMGNLSSVKSQSIFCEQCGRCRCAACTQPRTFQSCFRCSSSGGDSRSSRRGGTGTGGQSGNTLPTVRNLHSTSLPRNFDTSVVHHPFSTTTQFDPESDDAAEGCCSADRVVDIASCLCCVKACIYHHQTEHIETEELCACEPPGCCQRWSLLGLVSLFLPCLCCYWPLKGISVLCAECYEHCTRRGCHCEGGDSSNLSGPMSTSTIDSARPVLLTRSDSVGLTKVQSRIAGSSNHRRRDGSNLPAK